MEFEQNDVVLVCLDCEEITGLKILREVVDICYGHGIIETAEEYSNVSSCCESHDIAVMTYDEYRYEFKFESEEQ